MIISASRRTDIPGFYSEWFMNRLRAGYAISPNPWNPRQLSQVRLSPEHIDCIVFWTKNPRPMLDKLQAIDDLGYRYYFSFTVTPYGQDVERRVPPKKEVMETFRMLSDRLGPARVDWRFDPIVVNDRYSEEWHSDVFDRMCDVLGSYTERCVMNFVKTYRHIAGRVRELDDAVMDRVAAGLARIAREHRLPLYNCSDKWNLANVGIHSCACIDQAKIEKIVGYPISAVKDPGQPKICHCLESFDVGMYSTCDHGCDYCYALKGENKLRRARARHDVASPMLSGFPSDIDTITDRTRPSFRSRQLRLFDG